MQEITLDNNAYWYDNINYELKRLMETKPNWNNKKDRTQHLRCFLNTQ
jgi:hypothetical protein